MADEGYNGWTNYETWAVKLWIDNDETLYRYWQRRARSLVEQPEVIKFSPALPVDAIKREPQHSLADELKTEFADMMPDLGGTVWADLLNAAFSEVNWDEIARAILDEVKE